MRPFLANCPNHEDGLRSARPASTASGSRAADRLPKGPRRLPTAFVEARGDLDGVVLRARFGPVETDTFSYGAAQAESEARMVRIAFEAGAAQVIEADTLGYCGLGVEFSGRYRADG